LRTLGGGRAAASGALGLPRARAPRPLQQQQQQQRRQRQRQAMRWQGKKKIPVNPLLSAASWQGFSISTPSTASLSLGVGAMFVPWGEEKEKGKKRGGKIGQKT